jgi:hypothetical protein
MITSKFLTATLASLAVIGTAGLVYAQSSSTSPGPGTMNQGTTNPANNTMNQGSTNPPTGTLNQGGMTAPAPGSTMTTPPMNQNAPTMDQPLARADRN